MPKVQKYYDDSRLFGDEVCAFCGISDDNEILYGKYIRLKTISMHSNCMFFASGLCQRGRRETDGIFGFLLPDIEKELRRGKKLMCTYCRRRGATIGCCVTKCKKSFHLSCGLNNKSLHQFFGTFSSYCKDHGPKQPPIEELDKICHICFDDILVENLDVCLYSHCCKKGLFHRLCMQTYAFNAGMHFFKCPLCNNREEFQGDMENYGINIPNKDASWELEAHAFEELLERPECGAVVCSCPKGRKYTSKKNRNWTLLSCNTCGSRALHKTCGELKLSTTSWVCEECLSFEEKIRVNRNASASGSVLDTTSEHEPCLKRSTFQERPLNKSEAIDKPSSSSLSILTIEEMPSASYQLESLDNIHASQVADETASNNVNNLNGMKIHIKHNVKNLFSNVVSDKDFEKSNDVKICYNYSSNTAISKVPVQHKQQVNNLKDIKNFTPNALTILRSCVTLKPRNVKKVKRKKTEHVCSSSKQCCIRKYFVQDCGKYRL